MPVPQKIQLYGLQSIAPTSNGNYVLIYDFGTKLATNSQVHILVDGSNFVGSQINIILPPISSFNNFWNISINIVDVSKTASTIPIVVVCSGGNNVNGDASVTLSNDGNTASLMIASSDSWYSTDNVSGTLIFNVTYTQLQNLISNSQLIPSALYIISGFNKNMPNGSPENPIGALPISLYDDGNDLGITIYMYALTTSQMATSGYGEFYNPKYTTSAEYNNTDGTGLYQIWDGDNPDPLQVPAYGVADVVFWGGYAWENITGNVGFSIDSITLSPDWSKIPYSNDSWYFRIYDEINVDWINGIIVGRTNIDNNIKVEWTSFGYYNQGYFSLQINPIAIIPFGIYGLVNNGDTNGVSTLSVIESYADFINFKGVVLTNNQIINNSFITINYFGKGLIFEGNYFEDTVFYSNTFEDGTTYQSNKIKFGSFDVNNFNSDLIDYNTMISCNINQNISFNSAIRYNKWDDAGIFNNTLSSGSDMSYNVVVDGSSMSGNDLINNSLIRNNFLYQGSTIDDNDLDLGTISANTLYQGSLINKMVLENSVISNNTLSEISEIQKTNATLSSISYNNITSKSVIADNVLSADSKIEYNNLGSESIIQNCTLSNNSLISNNILSRSEVTGNNLDEGIIRFNSLFNNSTIINNTVIEFTLIQYNSLSNGSTISENLIRGSGGINYNSLTNQSSLAVMVFNTTFFLNNHLVNSYVNFLNIAATINLNNFYNVNISGVDISGATLVYSSFTVNIYSREDTQTRATYIDNTDVLKVLAVTA